MCPDAGRLKAKAGGLADVSALLVDALYNDGRDVHLAMPHYRHLFEEGFSLADRQSKRLHLGKSVHLAEDCHFYRSGGVYQADRRELLTSAMAFQREVINHIIPEVRPDIVHCNDWMTGLIPAAAKPMGIRSIFTIHNIHTGKTTLAEMEDHGIPAREFWDALYFSDYPHDFEESYWHNKVDFLASGILAADSVNVVSPTFLDEIISGLHRHIPGHINHLFYEKKMAGKACGIINAPDLSYDPGTDPRLPVMYNAATHSEAKRRNKKSLQEQLGLDVNGDAPLLFWPSRLDPTQKGCQLLSDILYQLIFDYRDMGLQLVLVADGPHQRHFHNIVSYHSLSSRVAVRDFSEDLSHLAYGSCDFVLMPSSFEPCGLPQMIGARYGTLPIAHNTGGLHDTVFPLDPNNGSGNGFLFDVFNTQGLRWAIDQALSFYRMPEADRAREITRVMEESQKRHDPRRAVERYYALYESL